MMSLENPFSGYWYGCEWGARPGREEFKEQRPCKPFTDYRDAPFDFDSFYEYFPEFEPPQTGEPSYSRKFIAAAAKQAAMFVKPSWCRELDGADRKYAFFLVTAHMAVMIKHQQSGLEGTSTPGSGATFGLDTMPGVMTQATVGSVSVSKTGQYQSKNMWEAWYYQTPYGRNFLAFMEQQVAAGMIYEGEENIANCLRD